MTRCTWKDCEKEACVEQKDLGGHVWANLCTEHDTELSQAITSGNPKTIVRCWARAHGNSKDFAKRMMGEGSD